MWMCNECMADEVHTGFAGHIDITEHQGIGLGGQLLSGFSRISGTLDCVAMGLQEIGEQTADRLLVVDDENEAIIEQRVVCCLVRRTVMDPVLLVS